MNANIPIAKLLNEGMRFFQSEDFVNARACFLRARKLAPKSFDAVYLAGISNYRLGELDNARKLLIVACQINPGHAEAINTLGNIYAKQDKLFSSIKFYRKALKIDEKYVPACLNLGQKLNQTGQYPQAQEYLLKAMEYSPDNMQIRLALSDVYSNCRYFDQAIAILPDVQDGGFYEKLVSLKIMQNLLASNKIDHLSNAFDRLGTRFEMDDDFIQFKAKYFFETGQIELARDYIKKHISDNFSASLMSLYLRLEKLILSSGEFTEFVKNLFQSEYIKPNASLLQIIESLLDTGEVEFARLEYEKLPRSLQETQQGLCLGEKIYENIDGASQKAVRMAQKAVEINTENEAAAICSARILIKNGNFKKALRLILEWREYRPNSQFWIAYETLVYRALGDERYFQICDYSQMVQIYDLPVPDGYSTIEEFNSDLSKTLTDLHIFSGTPLDQSLRSGTQSVRSLEFEHHPVIQKYITALEQPIGEYIKHLSTFDGLPLAKRTTDGVKIQGCWSVRLGLGGKHVNHVHPEGWVSSAYYVKTPQNSEIEKDGWIKFGEPPFPMPGADQVERWIKPEAGKLVLFPSYFWHGVSPVLSGEIRITAPFDLLPALSHTP